MIEESRVPAVVKVARDLHEIERLAAELDAEAVDSSTDRLMPGGKALVALAPVANLEAWVNRTDTAERLGQPSPAEDEDDPDVWEHPLATLLWWSEDWRRVHQAEYGQRATIGTEAGFLRWLLDWAWDNEPRFDDFAKDVRHARLRLEDIVHDGRRSERTRVVCDQPTCETHPRLVKVYAWDPDEDGYKCPACKHRFTEDDYHRAYRKQLRSEGAERYVPMTDALDTLRSQGRPERTIRKWLLPASDDAEHVVQGYCEVQTRRTWLWWPDLWTRHLLTPRRKRKDDAA